jgi:outer membrane protein TolC
MKYLPILLLCISLSVAADLSLEQYIAKVKTSNPSIRSLRVQVDGQQSLLQNTGSLPDPSLTYEGPSTKFKISQTINNPLKVGTEQSLLSSDVDLAKIKLEALIRSITVRSKRIYFNLFAVEKMIGLTQEGEGILDQMYQSSIRQYESNRVTQQDPLTMSLMRAEATIKLEQLAQERRTLLAEASRLAGGEIVSFSFPVTLSATQLTADLSAIQANVRSTANLDMVMAGLEYRKASQAIHLNDLSNLFMFDIGAGYDTTMQSFDWMAGISIPLWAGKTETSRRYQTTQIDTASANMEDSQLRVQSEAADLFYKIQSADRILPLYERDLIPKAKQARNLAKTSYEAGRLTLNEWATSEQRYLTISGQYFQALAARLSTEAELAQLTGDIN